MLIQLLATSSVLAQAAPVLNEGAQPFVQRGNSVDVTLEGQHLGSVTSMDIAQPRGLHVTLARDDKDGSKAPDNQIHLRVAADEDAALGDREVRLIGPGGVTAPLRMAVGQYPQFVEKEPNNTDEQAQEIPFPVTLSGRIDVPGDIDCFRFKAVKGQSIVLNVIAVRSGSQLDPVVVVRDQAGHERPIETDWHGGDPTVIFESPADGYYVMSIRDLQYRGGGDYGYRIEAGLIPYVRSILPNTAQAGKVVQIRPTGVNLQGADSIPLDLTYAADGKISIRAKAAGGLSNAATLQTTEVPAMTDEHPVHTTGGAPAVEFPLDVSGRLGRPGDENYYAFHVARRERFTLSAVGRGIGAPTTALLTLRDAHGATIQTADDTGATAAVISRELDPGDYFASVGDLFFNGGPSYAYRLELRSGPMGQAGEPPFQVRFLPDAVRVSRGSNAVIFFNVQRSENFTGDVVVSAQGLPPGVTCPPITVNDQLAGAAEILVVSAGPDAPRGSFPFHLRASSSGGGGYFSTLATPMYGGRAIETAYLTILDAAPFTLDPVAALTDARAEQLNSEADAIAARLASPDSNLQAAEAQWEKNLKPTRWEALHDVKLASAGGTHFKPLDDGSFLATDVSPEKDTYTLTAATDVGGITAIRLQAIPDPSLPSNGPGRNGGGNFVLSHLVVMIAPRSDPTQTRAVNLVHPKALLEQDGYPVIDAIEPKPGRGWAMYPNSGKPNEAIFYTSEPQGDDKGSVFTITLDQAYGQQHTLGRFRFSVTRDAGATLDSEVPVEIVAIVAKAADVRSPEEKARLMDYYRSVDPAASADAARLAAIRGLISDRLEIAQLEKSLAADNPAVKQQQEAWEKSVMEGLAWQPLEIKEMKSAGGATLTREGDDSVFVSGKLPATDVYTLEARTPVKRITAVRLEVLPDSRLPARGPGRAPNGNFVLSGFHVAHKVKAPAPRWFTPGLKQRDAQGTAPRAEKSAMAEPLESAVVAWQSAVATFEQDKYPATALLESKPDAGWALLPNVGAPSWATFVAAQPFSDDLNQGLAIKLEQNFSAGSHEIGRFRLWVTSNPNPDSAAMLPAPILAILRLAPDKRDENQKLDLARYYLSVAPALDAARHRLAELRAMAEKNQVAARRQKFSVPFLLNRNGFTGDVRVTMEGFVSTRDPRTAAPAPITDALRFEPVTLDAGKAQGKLSVEADANVKGPRDVVLRAEAKVGDETRVEYSLPFELTVRER